MAKTQYLPFFVCLTDEALVAELQARWPDGFNVAPETGAAVEWSAPWTARTPTAPGVNGCWSEFGYPDVPADVAVFTRSSGGLFGIGFLFGSSTKYFWIARFVYNPPLDVAPGEGVEAQPGPIMRRRWVDAGNLHDSGTGGNFAYGRDSGRLPGTLGFAIRGTDGSALRSHDTDEFIAGYKPRASWERFYVRMRARPTSSSRFWGANLNQGSNGFDLEVLPDGQLAIYGVNYGGTRSLLTTAPGPELGEWAKFDCVLRLNDLVSNTGDATIKVYVNGGERINQTIATNGIGGSQENFHASSSIGPASGGAVGLEADVSEWIGADSPFHDVATGEPLPTTQPGLDWYYGSHIQLVRATGYSGSGFSGPAGVLQQGNIVDDTGSGGLELTLATAGAGTLTATTDAAETVDAHPGALGVAALQVSAYAKGAGVQSLGYAIAGGSIVSAAVDVGNSSYTGWVHALYGPEDLPEPVTPIAPLGLQYTTDTAGSLRSIVANVELIGVWGPEDLPDLETDAELTVPTYSGVHAGPYPKTPWYQGEIAPIAPVVIVGGTYTGNGTAQDLAFRVPVTFWWARPLTGSGIQHVHWWSSLTGPHRGTDCRAFSALLTRACMDPAFSPGTGGDANQFQAIVRLAGVHVDANANGVTYQYIAVCDPGRRFHLNGAASHDGAGAQVNAWEVPGFNPQAVFLQHDTPAAGISGDRFYYKGPGHAGAFVSPLGGNAETNNTLTLAADAMTSQGTAIHGLGFGYSAWRRDDGSQDPGRTRVVQIATYTGNGSTTRTIGLAPVSARRPLFALVVPHNSAAPIFRDPSHTGTTSVSVVGSANASTGIVSGGLDEITVGTALNASGITYDVFVIVGGETAGNNGWSANGEFIPVEPDTAPGDFAIEPIDPDTLPPVEEPEPELPDPGDLSTDISAQCEPASRRLCNFALQELGVTQQIANLATEVSKEAQVARLVYKTVADQALREFPWPFATRYVKPSLVAGSATAPANADWQYAYRVPAESIFVRRIIREGMKRKPEPAVPFRLGSDDTGDLLFTDEPPTVEAVVGPPATPALGPEIEYTIRVACPAARGDSIFRQAVIYLLASKFAKPLGRESRDRDSNLAAYRAQLDLAELAHAREQEHQDDEGPDPPWIKGR